MKEVKQQTRCPNCQWLVKFCRCTGSTRAIHPNVRRFITYIEMDLNIARMDTIAHVPDLQSQFHKRSDTTVDLQEFLCEKVLERIVVQPL